MFDEIGEIDLTHRNKGVHLWVLSFEVLKQVVLELLLHLRPVLQEPGVGRCAPPPVFYCLARKLTGLVVVRVVGLEERNVIPNNDNVHKTWRIVIGIKKFAHTFAGNFPPFGTLGDLGIPPRAASRRVARVELTFLNLVFASSKVPVPKYFLNAGA